MSSNQTPEQLAAMLLRELEAIADGEPCTLNEAEASVFATALTRLVAELEEARLTSANQHAGLPERLRARAAVLVETQCGITERPEVALLREAADALTRLVAELEEARRREAPLVSALNDALVLLR